MNLLVRIKHSILNKGMRLSLHFKKNVSLRFNVSVDRNTLLEGRNKIYTNTQILSSEIGCGTYIGWNSILNNCQIGRFCSIAPFVEVIYGTHPISECLSTHPAFFSTHKQAGFTFVDKDIFDEHKYVPNSCDRSVVIGNDVWIGYGVKIMEGVKIGDGAIVAAGAVVTKDIDSFAVYGGVPAKFIKYRFNSETISRINRMKWWRNEFDWIRDNASNFNEPEFYREK